MPPATLPVAVSAASEDDPGSLARARFQQGERLYEEGRYEEAVAEFEAAHRLKPHPVVLYNIAQAYERLLDYSASATYFERYLRESPTDAQYRSIVENRLRVMRGLPARVSVSTVPSGATVVLSGPVSAQGVSPVTLKVPSGSYILRVTRKGYDEVEQKIRLEIGQPYLFSFSLEHQTGSLRVYSSPVGARVSLNTRLVGTTPYFDRVPVGEYRVLVEEAGYAPRTLGALVEEGKRTHLDVVLAKPPRNARPELIAGMTTYGAFVGAMVASIATSDSGLILEVMTPAAAGGAIVGFLASFFATRKGVNVGRSSLIVGLTALGVVEGGALAPAIGVDRQVGCGMALAGSAVGLGLGLLLAHRLDPSPGDVAMVNSGGMWGTAAGLLLSAAVQDDDFGAGFTLIGTNLGVVVGSILATRFEVSRGHVALVDLASAGGLALGAAVGAALRESTVAGPGMIPKLSLVGLGVGLIAGGFLTMGFDRPAPPSRALVSYGRERGSPDGRFRLGFPEPVVEIRDTPRGRDARFLLRLFGGEL